VQQLTAANLALTTTVATLIATNKKLVKAAARKQQPGAAAGAVEGASKTPGEGWVEKAVLGGYCWTHGHCAKKSHTSKTFPAKAEGHNNKATAADKKGGSTKNLGWDKA
jgi:hypothetical protein